MLTISQRSHLKALLGTAAVLPLLCGAAAAQNVTPSDGAVDNFVVWGTSVSSSSLYVGESEIEMKQADHLSDLLREIPGVDIGGTHSVNSRINFRGLDDRNLNVYIDGALQTNYLYHHIGNLLINPDILQSAELQLGTNTVTHGGLGGAIRFDTKDAQGLLAGTGRDFGARVAGTYNSNSLNGFSGTGYGQIGERVDFLGYYNRVDRGNFEDGSGRETIGSDGVTEDILFKAGVQITDNQRIEASYDRLSDKGDYTQRPDMGVLTNEAITGDILLPTEYERETINLSYTLDLGEALFLDVTYYMNDLNLWRDESAPGIPRGIGTSREAMSDNRGLNILAETQLATGPVDHMFKYGAELFDQNLSYVADAVAGSAPIEQESQEIAIFVEDAIGFMDNRFVLRPGVRYTDYELTYEETDETGSWDEFSFGLAGEVNLIDGLQLLASYTELFRGPELPEPFTGGGASKLVNPDLQPETGENIEIGVRYSGTAGDVAFNLGANYFETTIDNFIAETGVPDTEVDEVWDVNIGTAKIDGFEMSAHVGMGDFDGIVTYSSSNLDSSGLLVGGLTESLREVGDVLGLTLDYVVPSINLTLNWNSQFVMSKTTQSEQVKESYDIHNVSVRWDEPLNVPGLSVTAGIDNLLDKTYTSHASRTGATVHPVFGALVLNDVEPGRNFKITAAKIF